MSDIGSCFQPRNHPDVKAGAKLTQNVLNEFFQSLNTVSNTGYITLDQFLEYYQNTGAFDDDDSFEALMSGLWKPAAPINTGKPIRNLADAVGKLSVQTNNDNDYLPSLQQLKTAVRARGAYGIIGMGRAFRIIDDDGSKSLNRAEFKKAMNEYGLKMSESQLNQLFAYFDKDRSGAIDYEEFLQSLRVR